MGVKKLQTYMETCIGPEGFRTVSLQELKEQYEKENPGSPIEILLDVECCLRFIYKPDSIEYRYGGENVSLVKLIRNFFDKFNSLGIKLVSFYGNFTNKKKRFEWVRRRYETIPKIYKLINLMERNNFDSHANKDDVFVIPPGLCFTSTSIIKHVLKERVIQSLTENDIEIITYGKKNKSFAIISQDSDFIIANAAQYYLSMKHLDLDTMTTRLYDGHVLAQVHNLKLNQLPLYATLLGTDLLNINILRPYHNQFYRKKDGKMDLDYFFRKLADECRQIDCDNNCEPNETDMLRIVRNVRTRGCHSNFDELQGMMLESIQSFHAYQVEEELYLNKIEDEKTRNTLKIGMLLYRQCWITSDLLMLLCSRTMEMSTCMEIFDRNVKPVGMVLRRLRSVLYGATFNGNTRVDVEEFVVTGEGCFDHEVPLQHGARLNGVKPLLDVWQASLEPNEPEPNEYLECFDPLLSLDNVHYKTNESNRETSKEYFVEIFCHSCRISPQIQETLLSKFKQGLPQAILLPLFTFIYLDSDRYAYLHACERDAVLLTFTTISVLTQPQVEAFSHPQLKRGDCIPLMRAANMFRRATQVMINLNAVCGFPIPVEWLDGHNYWEGRFVQMFYQFLYNEKQSQWDLYQVIVEAIQKLDDCEPATLERFTHVINILVDLRLVDVKLKKLKT
uniref:Constitutive coactivator of peroxisome proliferator-activated receptor gamma n=2 Tax=Cacopsylla melanoneura TaxID=428564 RepID=A0A8D8LK43_9HEMI